MVVLALDTTTRRGSAALTRDTRVLEVYTGDPAITHGQRLPGDLMQLLDRCRLGVADVDLFAVAAGPGSFTGLRIGIATMQGFALANGKDVIGVSALDALHHASRLALSPQPSALSPQPSALTRDSDSSELAVWMDAQRGEVFSALYRDGAVVDGPSVERPPEILSRWTATNGARSRAMIFAGEGARMYREFIVRFVPEAGVLEDVPMLAPSIAALAEMRAGTQGSAPPDAIRPIYIRRPDAELARDRRPGP